MICYRKLAVIFAPSPERVQQPPRSTSYTFAVNRFGSHSVSHKRYSAS